MIFKVQSVIIPKSKFSEKDANDWIKNNIGNTNCHKIEEEV